MRKPAHTTASAHHANSVHSARSTLSPSSLSHTPVAFRHFLRDKWYFFAIATFLTIFIALFLNALRVRTEIAIVLAVAWLAFLITTTLIEYYRKHKFYRDLYANVNRLDQAYLVLETLAEPNFYDGEILYDVLYQINKSMAENVQNYRVNSQEFQDYIEMWIHEVKTPLATFSIITSDPKVTEQIKHLNDYVDQVLYLVRAENAERDYLIKSTCLADVVNAVANKNRTILQASQIDFSVQNLDYFVHTDSKWLEFILGQILNNSIKYQSTAIAISAARLPHDVVKSPSKTAKLPHDTADSHNIALTIRDNGLGIQTQDLARVFEKSFTGNNGRLGKRSTGMGLYIAKTLCDKLGHKISVNSVAGQFTEVTITFADHDYYKDVI